MPASSVSDRAAPDRRDSLLLVANYDSGVGYAWWLMESFWAALAQRWTPRRRVLLAFPSITTMPAVLQDAPLEALSCDFTRRDLRSCGRQLQLLRRQRVRSVYLTDQPAMDVRYALWRLAGVRHIIVHDHAPGDRAPASGLRALLKTLLHRLPLVNASALIAVTPFVHRRHLDALRFPAARCFVAPNGLPPRVGITARDPHAAFNIPRDRLILVMVGRAHPVKGLDFALQVMQLLRSRADCPAVHLLHIGDGPMLAEAKAQAHRLGIDDCVTFAGRREDVATLLAGCALAFHPSRGEVGYSLSILEAMQAALPVVVPDLPSVAGATVHDVTGLRYRPDDAASAAEALLALLRDDGRRRAMGEAAYALVARDFTLARSHAALLEAFERVHGGR